MGHFKIPVAGYDETPSAEELILSSADHYEELLDVRPPHVEGVYMDENDLFEKFKHLVAEPLKGKRLIQALILNLQFFQDYSMEDVACELDVSMEFAEKLNFEIESELKSFMRRKLQ